MTDSSPPVTVAVDVNGADKGPAEVARGAARAAASGVRVVLFGPAAEIGAVPEGVSVVDAPLSIAKAPDPARAVRANPSSSIVQAVRAVAAGEADALVSGGSTGAALAASLFTFKRAPGVHRPALALLMPIPGAPFLLLDAGANVEVRPEHLAQFAHMGAAYMEAVLGVKIRASRCCPTARRRRRDRRRSCRRTRSSKAPPACASSATSRASPSVPARPT